MHAQLSKYLTGLEDFQETQIVHEQPVVAAPGAGEVGDEHEHADQPTQGLVEPELEIEMAVDHDNTLSMLERTRLEQVLVEDQVEDVLQAQYALEQYAVLLKQAGIDGISKQAGAMMAVGLKQLDRVIGTEALTAGLEGYDATPRSAIQRAHTVALEDIKEKITEAYTKFKELIKKLIEQMLEGIEHLFTGITKAHHTINTLQEQAKSTKARDLGDAVTFEIAHPTAISVNGAVDLSTRSLSGLAAFSAHVYPSAVAKYYDELVAILKGYSITSGDASETIELMSSKTAPLDHLFTDDTIFPGNMEIDIAASGLVYGMKTAERAKPAPESYTHTVRSLSDITKGLKELDDILKILKRARDESGAIKAGADKLVAAVSAIESELGKDIDESSKAEAHKVVSHAMQMVHKTNPRGREILKYVARTVNSFAAVMAKELQAYAEVKA